MSNVHAPPSWPRSPAGAAVSRGSTPATSVIAVTRPGSAPVVLEMMSASPSTRMIACPEFRERAGPGIHKSHRIRRVAAEIHAVGALHDHGLHALARAHRNGEFPSLRIERSDGPGNAAPLPFVAVVLVFF